MNGDGVGADQGLKGFYAYKNTFGHDAVWLDIPKQGASHRPRVQPPPGADSLQ